MEPSNNSRNRVYTCGSTLTITHAITTGYVYDDVVGNIVTTIAAITIYLLLQVWIPRYVYRTAKTTTLFIV